MRPSWRRARTVITQPKHSVTNGDVCDAFAGLVDDARDIVTGCLRQLSAHQAFAHLPVGRVDPGRPHRDPNLARTCVWVRKVDDLKNLRAAELTEARCLHHPLRSRLGVARLMRAQESVKHAAVMRARRGSDAPCWRCQPYEALAAFPTAVGVVAFS